MTKVYHISYILGISDTYLILASSTSHCLLKHKCYLLFDFLIHHQIICFLLKETHEFKKLRQSPSKHNSHILKIRYPMKANLVLLLCILSSKADGSNANLFLFPLFKVGVWAQLNRERDREGKKAKMDFNMQQLKVTSSSSLGSSYRAAGFCLSIYSNTYTNTRTK